MKKRKPTAAKTGLSRGLRRYLYFTAAATGGIILIVEILGAKMLSPFFGASHFVWTAQIAVTLVSLAAGYFFGGWLADRSPKLHRLYYCILLAGLYLCLAIAAFQPMAYFCLRFDLAIGSALASFGLFFVPLTLLAVTGPFAIRALTQSTQTVGAQVGRVSAISTLGSVLGAVAVGYLIIPFAPNTVTMFVSALVLFLIAGTYFLLWLRRSKTMIQTSATLAIAAAAGIAGIRAEAFANTAHLTELARRNSNFGLMQVLESSDGTRYYLNDLLRQNIYDSNTQQSLTIFTYMLHYLAGAYAERLDTALVIGLGVGIVPRQLAAEGVRVDVVEINPRVADIARDFFGFDPAQVNLHIDDGRHFLRATSRQYDAILLDAFLGDSSPAHLMTAECFQSIKSRLRPHGVFVINCFGYFRPKKDFFVQSLAKTLSAVFPSLRVHDSARGNVFFVASTQPNLNSPRATDFSAVHPKIQSAVQATWRNIVDPSPHRGVLLRDDYNPVEYYDAAIRETIRKDLASEMQTP